MNPQEQVNVINRLCPCCGVDPEQQPLSLFSDNMEFAEMGAGYVVYFKMTIFFGAIWLVFAAVNVLKMIANARGSGCLTSSQADAYLALLARSGAQFDASAVENTVCRKDWITVFSRANYGVRNVDGQEQSWLMIFFFAYYVVLSLCKMYIKNTNKEIDRLSDTPSDWTLIVGRL